MKQLERRKLITYRWWRNDTFDITPEHIPALEERADERIAAMAAQGYTSGELYDDICMLDGDPEEGVEYTGWWETTIVNKEET